MVRWQDNLRQKCVLRCAAGRLNARPCCFQAERLQRSGCGDKAAEARAYAEAAIGLAERSESCTMRIDDGYFPRMLHRLDCDAEELMPRSAVSSSG